MKYTMEEFEKMYKEAQEIAIKNIDKSMEEAQNETGEKMDSLSMFAFKLQNMMVVAEISRVLFKKEEKNK